MNTNQTLRQTTLAKWSTIFQEQQSSGLTIKECCSQNNVSIHCFYYWKRAAKEEYLKSVMSEIIPVSIPSDPVPAVRSLEAPAPTEELECTTLTTRATPIMQLRLRKRLLQKIPLMLS